jgi:hypothetical protein
MPGARVSGGPVSEPRHGGRWPARLARVRRLGWRDWRHLTLAAAELLRARWYIARTPAPLLLEQLRRPTAPPPAAAPAAIAPERVGWAVTMAAGVVPWRSDCLVQAIAARRWLERERQPTHVQIGVHRSPDGRFEAHAWLRSGAITVTGGNVDRFTPLLDPAEHPRSLP